MDSYTKWLLLASSVLLYGLALMISSLFWWASFIFLIPLFYVGNISSISFKEAYLYGIFQWTVGAGGVLYSLIVLGQGPLYLRLIPSAFMVLYEAVFTALWLWGTLAFISHFSVKSFYWRMFLWMVTTCLYFYWVIHLSLSLLNTIEGYFLMNPLVPLAEYPQFLFFLPFLGKNFLLALLIFTNGLGALTLILPEHRIRSLLLFSVALLPWILSILLAQQSMTAPLWVNAVFPLQKKYSATTELTPFAKEIQDVLRLALKKNPKTALVILPESSLDGIDFAQAHELGHYWNAQNIGRPISIVLGAFNWEKTSYRNTAYWIYDGKLQGQFYKRHVMAVTEGIGHWYNFSWLRTLYHPSPFSVVTASLNERPLWHLLPGVAMVPYICSELFFNSNPDDTHVHAPIIALCNDHWASLSSTRRLMFLTAVFKACEWQREIVYVAYDYQGYINKQGASISLT